jgi:hypothetical protein
MSVLVSRWSSGPTRRSLGSLEEGDGEDAAAAGRSGGGGGGGGGKRPRT